MRILKGSLLVLCTILLSVAGARAFVGPSSGGGTGSGAIGVDSGYNVSVGTSTPLSNTRFTVVGSGTVSTDYAMKVIDQAGAPILVARNDGKVGIGTALGGHANALTVSGDASVTGTLTATTLVGALSGTLNASNVTAGTFGLGGFAFPGGVGIGTSTTAGIPQVLSVYGNGYFQYYLGVGVPTPAYTLDVGGTINSLWGYYMNGAAGATITCSAGQVLATTTVAGGIVTGGTCISIAASGVIGSGTANYVPRWSASSTLANSIIYNDGTNSRIGINQSIPARRLHVKGLTTNEGPQIRIESAALTDISGIEFYTAATGRGSLKAGSTSIGLYSASSSVTPGVSINQSTGFVGINTQTAPYPLTVQGVGPQNWYGILVQGDTVDGMDKGAAALLSPRKTNSYKPYTLIGGYDWGASDPLARGRTTFVGSAWGDLPAPNTIYLQASTDFGETTSTASMFNVFISGPQQRVGIGKTNPGYTLDVNGSFAATSKSFDIAHPTKPGYRLVHGSLEGPELGVYYRGTATLKDGKAVITLPEYFDALTRDGSETVLLTPKGETPFLLSYDHFDQKTFTVYGTEKTGSFDWQVTVERQDIPPLQIEKKATN